MTEAKIKTCKHCGLLFSTRDCKPCASKKAAEWYQKKKAADPDWYRKKVEVDPEWAEKIRAYSRAYSKDHPQARQARRADIQVTKPELGIAARKRRRERLLADPAKLSFERSKNAQYMRDNYERNREKREAYNRENSAKIVMQVTAWRALNWEAVARHANNRRARKAAVGGKLTRDLSTRLYDLQKGRCACCKIALGNSFDLDHIVPLFRGGANVDSNIQLLCDKCNSSKGAKDPVVFMQQRGFLI